MKSSKKSKKLHLVLSLISIFLFLIQSTLADECDPLCSNISGASEELKSQCQAYADAKKAVILDSVLLGVDGATEASCALACAEIAIPGVGAISGTACDAISLADNAADFISSMVQSDGHFSADMLTNLGGMGIAGADLMRKK